MSKVLIVEDEAPIASMYQFKLEKSGHAVRCAYNGEEGLREAEKFRPALILLDLRMPVMNGEIMLEKVRKTVWGSNIRVIILTNISKAEAPSQLRFLDVDRYIVKAHHTPTQVAAIVDEVLEES
ncbi:MAG TPA: response regulator [Candidatus Saccharimonadales bacterium]|nr:response regulator [Candidatus Saccharimonadales bacterium]